MSFPPATILVGCCVVIMSWSTTSWPPPGSSDEPSVHIWIHLGSRQCPYAWQWLSVAYLPRPSASQRVAPKPAGTSHPGVQRSDGWTRCHPTKTIDGHGNRQCRHREITSSGIFLPWNRRSCEGSVGIEHRWLERSLKVGQLLAQIL